MELKTKIDSEDGKQDLMITREFDVPLELLFKAYEDPEIFEQWYEAKVLKLESKQHGSYQLEKTDDQGNVVFRASGVIHEFVPNRKIIRTFEMENTPFPVQLEFLEFEELPAGRSKLNIHVVYRSVADRDKMLQLPFAQGINMAHNRLEEVVSKLK